MTPLGDVPSPRHACVVVWSDLDDGFYVFGGWVPDTARRGLDSRPPSLNPEAGSATSSTSGRARWPSRSIDVPKGLLGASEQSFLNRRCQNNSFHRMNATGDAPEPRDDGGGAWVGNGIVIFERLVDEGGYGVLVA